MVVDMSQQFISKMANNLASKSDIEKSLWLASLPTSVRQKISVISHRRSTMGATARRT